MADEQAETVSSSNDLLQFTKAEALLLGISSAMMLAGVIAIIYASRGFSDSSLWFIGFLLIALSGLSLTAAIFRALGYNTPGEAFGLPTGSIRALLAIGIMVLLVIFGLPLVSWKDAPVDLNRTAIDTVYVDCAAASGEAARYKDRFFVTLDTKACTAPPAPGQKARIAIFGNSRVAMSDQDRELSKQIITAIITLLTTIIGFYFGSQNAINLINAIKRKPGENGAGEGGKKPPVAPENPDEKGPGERAETETVAPDEEDGCPSDAEPHEGEAITRDEDLPDTEGGIEPSTDEQKSAS
jgi:hypothetical protein